MNAAATKNASPKATRLTRGTATENAPSRKQTIAQIRRTTCKGCISTSGKGKTGGQLEKRSLELLMSSNPRSDRELIPETAPFLTVVFDDEPIETADGTADGDVCDVAVRV